MKIGLKYFSTIIRFPTFMHSFSRLRVKKKVKRPQLFVAKFSVRCQHVKNYLYICDKKCIEPFDSKVLSENPIIWFIYWLIDWWGVICQSPTSPQINFFYMTLELVLENNVIRANERSYFTFSSFLSCCRSNRVVSLRILEVVVFTKKENAVMEFQYSHFTTNN